MSLNKMECKNLFCRVDMNNFRDVVKLESMESVGETGSSNTVDWTQVPKILLSGVVPSVRPY